MTTSQSTQKIQWLPLLISIAIPLAIGFTASLFTETEGWYQTIKKPSFNPPDWVFGPVWTLLYITMGIASYLIWQLRDESQAFFKARSAYVMQLVFNFLWSLIFFRGQNILGGMAIIVLLLVLIITTIVFFRPISKTAALLMVPYLLWVAFASFLNYSILMLNQ